MQLARCIDEAMTLPGIDLPACERLRERVADGRFNLVVVGEFNRGKSSVINALLGAPVLPVGVVPLTSVLTEIRYGDRCRCTVQFANGEERDIAMDEMMDFATERGNPDNGKGVAVVRLEYPSPWLGAGVRLVDTPGIGSLHRHNSDVTLDYLPEADAVLFVASVDQAMGRAELDFLVEIRRHAAKVVCVLNKADHLTEAELREAEANAELVQQSGLVELRLVLRRLLGEDRLGIWLVSMTSGLLRILARCRLAAELELKGLSEPVEKLEASLELFRHKKEQALHAVADDDVVVSAEAKTLVVQKVEPDLDRFKTGLQATLGTGIERRYEELARLRSRCLQQELEDYVVAAVRAAYDEWRVGEEAGLRQGFEALRERLWKHVEAIVDVLLCESAQLFALPYETVRTVALARPPSGFRYKFWEEPASMMLLGASLLRWMPKVIAAPAIRRRVQRRAADLIEMQGGRLRHHFEEWLKADARDLRAELRLALESAMAGIETAIANGMALRQRGEDQMSTRRAALANTSSRIEALGARIHALMTA